MSGVKPVHITVCPKHNIVWAREAEDQVEEELWAFKILHQPDDKAAANCRRATWIGCYNQNSPNMDTFTIKQLKKVLAALDTHLKGDQSDD
jgi:hypothetical protein